MGVLTPKMRKLAVLIDSDNATPAHIGAVLATLDKHGTIVKRRAYGDWTKSHLSSWKTQLAQHSIEGVQQSACAPGKNSTDIALVIDAMDLLHSGGYDGFCLISSDSDFTRLATRIRENGLVAYGVGMRHTPQTFVKACSSFIYYDTLNTKKSPVQPGQLIKSQSIGSQPSTVSSNSWLLKALRTCLPGLSNPRDWIALSVAVQEMRRRYASFDEHKRGHGPVLKWLMAEPSVEVMRLSHGHPVIRIKPATAW